MARASLPRLLRAAVASAWAILGALVPAHAQTPDDMLDCADFGAGSTELCKRCQKAPNMAACMCAGDPKYCPTSKVKLGVTVQLGAAKVVGAKVVVTSRGASLERTTDASGDALFEVGVDPKAKSQVVVKSVSVTQATRVPGVAFPIGSGAFTLAVDREVPLAPGETSKRTTVALPSARLNLTAVMRDPKTGAWAPARARAVFSIGANKAFSIDAERETKAFDLLVPPDKVGRDYRVQGTSLDAPGMQDTTSFRIPKPGGTVFLTLYLGDLMTQLERARAKLHAMLVQAYGPEVAARITQGVRFELADVATASYDAGVFRIPANWKLGSPDEMETLFHEWGHRVQDVLAHDLRASFSVGGRTESAWANDTNEWRAFDEARANFYSQLFTASLRYPGDQTFNEAKAAPHIGKCRTCPGLMASALVTHYRDPKLYTNALEIARDVRDVHDEAVRTLGHPPRTYTELIKAKESLVERQRAAGQITAEKAAALVKSLRETNTRFKLP
ncbi:MAG: hypothetical protein IPK71_09505 [Myxococcales bacterium]|nr:hypothetical protein [Myxococcales bacterium]